MKVSEFTSPGFYWYTDDVGLTIVELCTVHSRLVGWFTGADASFDLSDLTGDIEGPIMTPAELDQHISMLVGDAYEEGERNADECKRSSEE